MSDEIKKPANNAIESNTLLDVLDFGEWWDRNYGSHGVNEKQAALNGWKAALSNVWLMVNRGIKHGDLEGNGTDQTAQRNGQVLAANQIAEFIRTSNDKMTLKKGARLWTQLEQN